MFNKLLDFKYKRDSKQAVGFYLSFLLLNLVIGGVFGGLFGHDISTGAAYGLWGAIITQAVIGTLLLMNRNRYKNLMYIILVLLSLLLTKFGGALFGLIPLAYLTTK